MSAAEPWDQKISDLVGKLEWTSSVTPEIANTKENDAEIARVVKETGQTFEAVQQAAIACLEDELAEPYPDKELDDLIVNDTQRGFMDNGDGSRS